MADDANTSTTAEPKPANAAVATQEPEATAKPTRVKAAGDQKTVDKSVEAKEVGYKTTGDFQLYDVTKQKLYLKDEVTKAMDNDQFVLTHLKRGNLKKA